MSPDEAVRLFFDALEALDNDAYYDRDRHAGHRHR
jgi:hypothetical protein